MQCYCDTFLSYLGRTRCTKLLLYVGFGEGRCRQALPLILLERLLPSLKSETYRLLGNALATAPRSTNHVESYAVITAYLMQTEQLSQEDALESLRKSCEFVCPNDSFLDQLQMFEAMGYKVDTTSSIYKQFRLKILGDSYNRGEIIDSSKFGVDPGLPTGAVCLETSIGVAKSTPSYLCKKCRRVVALQENVVEHIPGEGESCFAWQKRRSGNPFDRSDKHECSSVFVEPLRWMKTVEEGALEGKLSCVHCDARLGYFNWSGIQCSCGSWITPAFQLHKSRVDISNL